MCKPGSRLTAVLEVRHSARGLMPEEPFDNVVEQISSRNPEEAWNQFLDDYSATILQVVRRVECDSDFVADSFQFVSERLSANSLRSFRNFPPPRPPLFSTCPPPLLRNLSFDCLRTRFA